MALSIVIERLFAEHSPFAFEGEKDLGNRLHKQISFYRQLGKLSLESKVDFVFLSRLKVEICKKQNDQNGN